MDVRGKNVTVVGGARSGQAAARLLIARDAQVFLTDHGQIDPKLVEALEREGAQVESGGHSKRAKSADLVVVSPGVPSTIPLLNDVRAAGVPVVSEIELASWFCTAPVVAITGSNGKTTTTNLTGHVFRSSGRAVMVGGNVGYPFSEYVRGPQHAEVVVLEVSSFQLDEIDMFSPRVSMLLNITPDHLDRYDNDFNKYAASKFRICSNQKPTDAFIYNADDEEITSRMNRVPDDEGPVRYAFSQEREVAQGAFVRNRQIVLRLNDQEEELMQTEELALRGKHNLYNSLAAAIASRVMEVQSDVVRESLASFEGVPHRLEFVREFEGARYVNDSKATNVNAVWYALESIQEKVILIAGGRDKGNDYGPLRALAQDKVRVLIAIGESAPKVAEELGGGAEHVVNAETMEEAVQRARLLAEPGDVVLLSPACASFDMYENYEHRGDVFRRAVMDLD